MTIINQSLTLKQVGTTKFYYITRPEELAVMLDDLKDEETLEIDTETMRPLGGPRLEAFRNVYNELSKSEDGDGYGAFDPHTAMVRLLQLRGRETHPFVVDILKLREAGEGTLEPLKRFLREKGRTYLGHHIQFDLKHIASSLQVWLPRVECTYQMSVMLSNALGGGQDRGHGLADCARDFLGINLSKTEQASDWSRHDLTDEQLEYAALDVMHLHDLRDILKSALCDDLGMQEPFELEMAVLPPTARMEFWGMPVDTEMIRKVRTAAFDALPDLLQDVAYHFRDKVVVEKVFINGKWYRHPWLNLRSKTAQVLPLLQEYGLDIEDTQRATLEAYRETFPGVGALVDYYNIEKQSSFDYMKYVHGVTGRIHGRFKPSGASTGRFSSTDPNCQQIPGKVYLTYTHPDGRTEKVNYRYCFHAEPGWLLASCDFSGQELAVMAAISGDETMMHVLNTGGDLHSEAAAGMFGIDPKDARQPKPGDPTGKSYRDYGKILMFSLAYGKTPAGFAADWGVSEDEAKGYVKGFEKRFPKLTAYLERAGKESEESNISRIVNGAIRFVGGGEGRTGKSAANRAGKNNRVQGLSSWMTRIAGITLDEIAMKGRIENKWALEALEIANSWRAERGMPALQTEFASKELQANPDPVYGLLPLQPVAYVHDEVLNHFRRSDSCPWTLQREGRHEAWNEANARLKAADKAKDDAAKDLAKADLKAIEKALQAECDAICPDTYIPGRECVTFMEMAMGTAMELAGTYYLRGKVPAGFSTATAPVWAH